MSLANEVKGTGVSAFCVTPAGVIRLDETRMPRRPEGGSRPVFPGMPGFDGFIPPEAGGAAIVYCIQNAEKLHGSGIIISEAFEAMNYPFPNPATFKSFKTRRLNDMQLTLVLCNMGPGLLGYFDE
jgi:hypothetical protein